MTDTTDTATQTAQDTSDASTDTTENAATQNPTLTTDQEIGALRAAHQFFSNFDRVPGFLTNQWSQALDTIAVVANSLINKNNAATGATDEAAPQVAETTVTQ